MAIKFQEFWKCPACGEVFKWTMLRTHWEEARDDAHDELYNGIERAADDAYFDAEIEFYETHCEPAYVKRRKPLRRTP